MIACYEKIVYPVFFGTNKLLLLLLLRAAKVPGVKVWGQKNFGLIIPKGHLELSFTFISYQNIKKYIDIGIYLLTEKCDCFEGLSI